jgi:hypothetical protein
VLVLDPANSLFNKEYMNYSVVITSLISAILTWVFMYLDSRLFDTPKSKFTYFKGIVFVSAVSATIVYFMGTPTFGVSRGGAPGVYGTGVVQGLNQEIFTGITPF